jgi:hypothetical protein
MNNLNMNIYRNKKKLIKNMKCDIYIKLYNDVINKISMYANNLDEFCIIEIPIFQFGKSEYNINEALQYIISNLNNEIKNNNLHEVIKYEPNILYISWKLE